MDHTIMGNLQAEVTPHKFDTWLPSIKAKLRVDGKPIGASLAQFYYVYLNLESGIQAMVLAQLSQAEVSRVLGLHHYPFTVITS